MDFILLAAKEILKHAEELAIWSAVMVSVTIAIIGALKPFIFPAHKGLRKTALSVMNIGASFASTAIYFFSHNYSWKWYFAGVFLMAIYTIVVYHLYENWHIRDVFHKIGGFAINKGSYLLRLVWDKLFHKTDKNIKAEWKVVQKELETFAKNEIKVATKKFAKADKELENL